MSARIGFERFSRLSVITLAIAVVSCSSVSAEAGDEVLQVLDWTPNHMMIELDGGIEFFVGAEFRKLAGGRRGGTLLLRSDGGDVSAAMTIGGIVRELGWTTTVPMRAQCYSACAMIWAAGADRHVARGAAIGFHGPYSLVGEDQITQGIFGSGYYAEYYRNLGYGEAAIEAFMYTPPDVFILTKEKAVQLGVTAHFD